MTTTYPNLGFDPSPGSLESVETMRARVATSAESMVRANELMNQLRSSAGAVWQGDAGDAFRSHLNQTLIEDLGKANQSLNEAVTALGQWSVDLSGYKQRADALEAQAATAQHDLDKAEEASRQAAANPDFGLARQTFDNVTDLQNAQNRLDNAASALSAANDRVDVASSALATIRRKAQDLHDEWDGMSSRIAEKIRHAAEWAPHEPGLLKRLGENLSHAVDAVGDWVKNHLEDIHSVLSTVSAVAGLVAIFTPPPIDVIALTVSLVAGAGALAASVADPKIRDGIGGLLHGDFSKQNLKAAGQVGGDVIGLIPGFGVGKGLVKGEQAFHAATEGMPSIVRAASAAAKDSGLLMKGVSKIPGVAGGVEKLSLAVGLRNPEVVVDAVEEAAKTLNKVNKIRGAGSKVVSLGSSIFGGGDD